MSVPSINAGNYSSDKYKEVSDDHPAQNISLPEAKAAVKEFLEEVTEDIKKQDLSDAAKNVFSAIPKTWEKFKAKVEMADPQASGGDLFILSAQSQREKASNLSKIGHAGLGTLKLILASTFKITFFIPFQLLCLLGGAILALDARNKSKQGRDSASEKSADMATMVVLTPSFVMASLWLSAYRDFRLTALGQA